MNQALIKALESALITGAVLAVTTFVNSAGNFIHNPIEIAAIGAIGTAIVRFLQSLIAQKTAL